MSTLREAAKAALEALELAQTDVHWELNSPTRKFLRKAEKTLRAALAQEQAAMTADDLADSIKRGEKWKVIGCVGHDCEECQTRIARDALGNFQHQRKGI